MYCLHNDEGVQELGADSFKHTTRASPILQLDNVDNMTDRVMKFPVLNNRLQVLCCVIQERWLWQSKQWMKVLQSLSVHGLRLHRTTCGPYQSDSRRALMSRRWWRGRQVITSYSIDWWMTVMSSTSYQRPVIPASFYQQRW